MLTGAATVVITAWWVGTFFMTVFYGTYLTAFRNSASFTFPYSSMDDILEKRWFFQRGRPLDTLLSFVSKARQVVIHIFDDQRGKVLC